MRWVDGHTGVGRWGVAAGAGAVLVLAVSAVAWSRLADASETPPAAEQPGAGTETAAAASVPRGDAGGGDAGPAGIAAETLREPVTHAGIVIYPPGEHPGSTATEFATGWSVEPPRIFEAGDGDAVGLFVPAEALPAGYVVRQISGTPATSPEGVATFVDSLVEYGDGGPGTIRIARWLPAEFFAGEPFKLAAFGPDSPVAMTLATAGGRDLVLVHTREGVGSTELQQVWFADGDHVVEVESRGADLDALVRVAVAVAGKLGE
ncbi:MAG: hypothetical protein IT303_16060 [Dehalococcoidia bacterium]|nr:hypothetical protein [Dehalococcoidia bacterium]